VMKNHHLVPQLLLGMCVGEAEQADLFWLCAKGGDRLVDRIVTGVVINLNHHQSVEGRVESVLHDMCPKAACARCTPEVGDGRVKALKQLVMNRPFRAGAS